MSFEFFIICLIALGICAYWIHEEYKRPPTP